MVCNGLTTQNRCEMARRHRRCPRCGACRGRAGQTICKPGSVSGRPRVAGARMATIHLGPPLPTASCDQPGRRPGGGAMCRPYSILLPVGFAMPAPLPGRRCALTAPFHPYPRVPGRTCAGGLLSVALSLKSPSPGVTRHRASVEPGLSSPPPNDPAGSGPPRDSGPGDRWVAGRPPDRLTHS